MSTAVIDAPDIVFVPEVERTNDQGLECWREDCHELAEWMVHYWCGCMVAVCNDCLKRTLRFFRENKDFADVVGSTLESHCIKCGQFAVDIDPIVDVTPLR